MFRRIFYHIRYRTRTFIEQIVIYLFLFTFFVGSLLTTRLSNVLETVISQSSDMNVSVYSPITSPVQQIYFNSDHFNQVKTYTDTIQTVSKQPGIDYYDYSISLNAEPVKPVVLQEDGTFRYYCTTGLDEYIEEQNNYYDLNPNYGITFKGISNANTDALRNHSIIPFRNGTSVFFTQDEIDNEEPICFIPNYAYASWHNANTDTEDTFSFSTAVTDENGNVTAYKQWDLKVVGTYLMSGVPYITNADGTGEIPIYIPLGTLLKIRDEAISFQNEHNPYWLDSISFHDNIELVHPVTFEMHDLDSAKNLIQVIQNTEAYKNDEIQIQSSITDTAPVYASIYSITSSFSILAAIIAGITVLFVSINACLTIQKQKKEYTLLQALGLEKKKIVLQSAFETSLSITLSALLSIPLALKGIRLFGIYLFDTSVKDQSSALASSIRHSFSLNDIKVTPEMMNSLLNITPKMLIQVLVLILLTILICFIVTDRMIRKFHPREVLTGGN